ncbi:MAG TPA: glycosyltransferase family 2 protein [Candidatus Acidoferrales bacterium]|nr:glycosyltransferase family 2 protein [Candidatus Acidoferrales bacterium]HXK07111.1 glycosyltransferase family 2 protein [Verrucomicrobiae bacterium]
MKTISINTPCYNEEANVEEVYRRVRDVMASLGRFRYEHIFIDNASTDRTVEILKRIAAADTNVRIIVNARNFGHIRSPIYGAFQARGDAVIGIVADLQDPPEMIPQLIDEWEKGYSMVLTVKRTSEENPLMFWIRKRYYRLVNQLSSIQTFENFTGFGLYDRRVLEILKSFGDPYPYFRGQIAEIGLPWKAVPYDQPRRKRGITKNNFYTLYDMAMLGITNLSKVPLRLVTFLGFFSAAVSILVGLVYLVYKLLFWERFSLGVAPIVIGIFLFSSVQLISLGIIGEYIGSVHTYVQKRPLVVERERINFEHEPGMPKLDS